MKPKTVVSAIVFCIAVLGGSTVARGQRLYPVQGPLAQQTPAPVFKGQIRRPMFSRYANFMLLKSFTFTNGEVLKGSCDLVIASTGDQKIPGTTGSIPPQPNLAFAWDTVMGPGFYDSQILGRKIIQGVFRGDKDTILQVESQNNHSGVAEDTKGNIYKIVW